MHHPEGARDRCAFPTLKFRHKERVRIRRVLTVKKAVDAPIDRNRKQEAENLIRGVEEGMRADLRWWSLRALYDMRRLRGSIFSLRSRR